MINCNGCIFDFYMKLFLLDSISFDWLSSLRPGIAKTWFRNTIAGHGWLIIFSFFIPLNLSAQKSIKIDTTRIVQTDNPEMLTDPNHYLLSKKQINNRVRIIAAGNIVGYSAVMIGLNSAWYANYPRSSFHTFNDNKEWLQVDKVGHMYSAYLESRLSMEMWRWTGIGRTKRIIYGGLSGAAYQTIIETLDGFSAEWGWSWGDFTANMLGSGAVIAQELAWNDQRIKLKFSFHVNDYENAELNKRADKLFGNSITERFLKDYNAQTYWASANLKSFLPKSNLPKWLSVAVGYGGNGMFGGTENIGKDPSGIINFNRPDIKRYRQWYLAPDIDLTNIKTNKKLVKVLFVVLSSFKFPAPSLEFSNGKFSVNAISF